MTDIRYDRREGPRDRSLRVGDKERDGVSEILRQRHLEGRLEVGEFHDRLDRCLTAKTYAELDELIADFPGEEAPSSRGGEPSRRRGWPLLFPILPLALIAGIALGGHVAWLAIPLVFFFVVRPLVWRAGGGWGGRGPWACGPRRSTNA
jgi:hypothetical protein